MEKDDPPPYTNEQPPAAVEPSGDPAPSDAELPKHAGFDLTAMKKIIENAELDPAELHLQDPGKYPVPPIPPPISRSESAPSPLHESPSTTPVMRSSLQLGPEPESGAGPSSHTDINAAFQRSMSMNNLDEEPEPVMPSTRSQPSQAILQDGFGATSSSTPRPSGPSVLSSADSDSKWPADSVSKPDSHGSSTDTFAFANRNGSVTPFGSSYSLPHNPFADFSSQSVGPSSQSAGLSFGGADGSITPHAEAERDPWHSRPPQTKVSGYSSNPWQT
jgi:hypothetical protein